MTQQKNTTSPKTARRGITLVEIAIVLVIVGLLLGGVLKGQELINNAKIRNIADRQLSLKIAWYSFIARYQAMPGDYVDAAQNIPGAGEANGFMHIPGDGIITATESPIVFQNLTAAGFLRCPQCTAMVVAPDQPVINATNSPQNSYGGVMAIYNSGYFLAFPPPQPEYAFRGTGNAGAALMTHSGPLIPSNIAAEVDRKIDDGIANEGDLVFNGTIYGWNNPGLAINPGCMTSSAIEQRNPMAISSVDPLWWRHADAPVQANCGFSLYL
ncbi:MAG: prepilin-type N-terminal cleavage/methylation domain-containing protein [Gammaproteobacteria bacterium]